MKHSVRTVLVLFLFLVGWVQAQSIALQPASGYDNSSTTPKIIVKLFFSPTDSIILNWGSAAPTGANFLFGSSSGNYNLGSISGLAGLTQRRLKLGSGSLSLSTGRYYGIITNSSARTLAGIQAQASGDPATYKYSNEIQFVVEAQNAPSPDEPRSTISNSTPTFKWSAIPGVPAYWIIVSSTPFSVKTVNGNPQVQGANIVWDYIATGTSATYGQISPSSPFTQSAIPLFAGTTYYYTLLNMYDQNDVAYASTVFGGIVSFTYQSQSQITAPNLISPADASIFNAVPTIRFQWDAVPGANSYTLYLFNRVTSFAGSQQEIDLPVWNGSTTNTQIDFAARQNLLKGKYVWFVVPNTATGAGVASLTRSFNYVVTLGKFRFTLSPTNSSSNLVNYSLQINSTTGGYSPSVPLIISNTEVAADSIPVDIYQFTAKKPGYYDTTYTISLNASSQVNQVLKIRPYPSTVSGKVLDQTGTAVREATVQFINILNNATQNFTTSTSGEFSVNIPQGSYKVSVSKPGYLSPAVRTYTVEQGQLDITSSPFTLTLDKVTFSGTTVNDVNLPVQLATVKATKGTIVQEVSTNANGVYSFELSSGNWVIEAAKSGFVSPTPLTLNLVSGTSVSGQSLVLIPRANQLNGTIYKVVQSGGTSSLIPAAGVTVVATPVSGAVVTGVTGTSGQYQLSLKSGTYTIAPQLQGYSSGSNPQVTLTVGQTVTGVDINLNPNPSSVSGIVSSTGGGALSDAVVSTGSATATSLPTGNYQLSLSAGTHTLTVTKAGFVTPATVTVSLAPGQQLTGIDFSLSPNASTISGAVKSLGQPLANAKITAQQGTNAPIITTTGNTGEFLLSVVPGNWKLIASKAGFLDSPTDTFYVGAGQTSANHLFDLTENTATVKGIIASNGIGVSNVSVTLKDAAGNSLATLTNVNGEYSLSVPAGVAYNLVAALTGYSTFNANISAPTAAQIIISNGTISALPASISGKVLNSQGQAINAAKVYLVENSGATIIDSTITDVTGAYSLGTQVGTYRIRAALRGYTIDEDVIAVTAGQALTNINMSISANYALVTGTVKEGNNPISGAFVSLETDLGGGSATSAADGTFSILQLAQDTYQLKVAKSGYASNAPATLTLAGGETRTLNLTMDKLSGSISGTVANNTNVPLSDVTVSLTSSGGTTVSVVTNSVGFYSLNNLALDTYTVSAVKNGYSSPAPISVQLLLGNSTKTVNIDGLKLNNAVISGKVTTKNTISLSDATIRVSGRAGSAIGSSDLSGNFAIGGLAEGSYEVLVSKSGYVTQSATRDANAGTVTFDLQPANSKIPGIVRSDAGALGFPVTVTAISGGVSQTATTDDNGRFVFSNMASNAQYSLVTNIFKEGYSNANASVQVPLGADSVNSVILTVKVSRSKIRGGVKVGGATVVIVNKANNETYNTSSSSNGGFALENLPAGAYTVTPKKAGYKFTPETLERTVAQDASSDSLVFDAQQNVGRIKLTAVAGGSPLSGVRFSAVSASNDVYIGETDANGEVTLVDVVSTTAGVDYTVTASKTGYSAAPVTVNVKTGAQSSSSVTLTANTLSVSGAVMNTNSGTGQDKVTITYKNNAIGQVTTISKTDGAYSLTSLPSGAATLTASLQGFTTVTKSISLDGGTANTVVNFDLTPAYAGIYGNVLLGTTPQSGVTVTVTGSSIYTMVTGANGYFEFNYLPIATGASDTTTYKVTISGNGIAGQTQVVKIPSNKVAKYVPVPDFKLPNGEISIKVNNNQRVLEGVAVTFIKPDGSSSQSISDKSGNAGTYTKLAAGNYLMNVSFEDYLIPDTTLLKVKLNDNQVLPVIISLPYRFTPLTSLDASKQTTFAIKYTNTNPTVAFLYLKQGASGSYQEYPLTQSTSDTTYKTAISLNNRIDDVSYYLVAKITNLNIVYSTPVYSIKPEASNMLSSIDFSPVLDGITVRKSDTYEFTLLPKNSKNVSLADNFTKTPPTGTLTLEGVDATAFEVVYPKSSDPTVVQLKVLPGAKDGKYTITAVGTLEGNVVRKPVTFTVGNIVLSKIEVNSGITELSNTSKGYRFTYSGIDTSKKSVRLGTGLDWSITPASAGTIDATGLYVPADSTFIGTITVTASDKLSKKAGSFDVKVYANINPKTRITLTDKMGMTLKIDSNSVLIPIRITLDKQQFGPGKKYFVSGDLSYIVQNTQYPLAYDADQALVGNKLQKAAELIIPVDNSLALFEGNRTMGIYNFDKNEWSLLTNSTANSSTTFKAEVAEFGEYSILAENEDLGVSKLAVLPSPFSPEVAPLKIGFKLSTKQRNASVNIRIFNLRGELVRHLMHSEQLSPNIYGSAVQGAKVEILWDGKTDDGKNALNGTYIVQVTAQDATGSVSKLIQAVLVK